MQNKYLKPLFWLKNLLLSSGVLLLIFFGYIFYLYLTGNFHTVIAGEIYRSAQPGTQDIEKYQRNHKIRSIINLRGENKNAPWYQAEIQQSQKLGISHYDFRMSADKEISQEVASELIALLKSVEKPVLVHCQGGADRTGLAIALYLASVKHADEELAEWQLSPLYGHFPIPFLSQAYPMDVTFEKLEDWLGYKGS